MKTVMRRFFAGSVIRNVRGEAGARGWGGAFREGGRKGLVGVLLIVGMAEAFGQAVGDYRSNATVMDWSAADSWEKGNGTFWVPATTYPGQVAATGIVTIQSGHTITMDVSPAHAVGSLLVEATGILQYEAVTAQMLRVTDIIRINRDGIFRSALNGTVTTHELIIAGSIVNEGTLNFSTNNNAAGVGITFTGAENEVFDLSGATLTNLSQTNGLVLNKGTSASSILWFTPGRTFQVRSGTNPAVGFLTITNGTFAINGIHPFSDPLFYAITGNYTIPPTGGFLLDNPQATIVGMFGTLTNEGHVSLRRGTYHIGTGSGNESLTTSNGRWEMSGGILNISGRFRIEGGNCVITGGTMNLATFGHSDRTRAAFYVSENASLAMSGDPLITFAYPNSNATPYDDIEILTGTGEKSITGGTFQMGTAATPATRTFLVNSDIPIHNLVIYNRNTRVSLTDHLTVHNQLTINGRLLMNNFDLNMGAPAIAGDFGANKGMIVTGTGEVRKTINTVGSYLFPFGNASAYLPDTLNFTGGIFTPGATVSVGMVSIKHPENVNTTNFLKRYWTVRTTGIANPVYDFMGTYANPDIVGNNAFMTTGIYTTVWKKFYPSTYVPYTIIATGLTGNVDLSGINVAAPVVMITPASASICSGTAVQLTAVATGNPTLTYFWSPAGGLSATNISNPVANPNTTTTYMVVVTDKMNESVSANATVEVKPLPAISLIYHN